ncbi:Camphor resistance CrcB protein [Ancylobacter novellus DSM 506]|uniref:Fluoride-specific ion channel FluC n=1 Tax=Ancylobacter novellus (strain ATCC 8093 / DSM 506 / JCM 20403 / CCM 1077 / IAM 12100 / NBRC 12443 / NCIMB 10456) TaxID=639283 RepID=D7A8E5_ANCN5|nr:Camphor resistance CrcB protein [Ancylobacter novellus DSM 506]
MLGAVTDLIWVALGSSLGGPARYFLSGLIDHRLATTFPWGTIVVNISGAMMMGALAATAAVKGLLPLPAAWEFAAVGFMGSYTTVSSFSLQTLMLARDGDFARAGANVGISLIACFSAIAIGFAAATSVLS